MLEIKEKLSTGTWKKRKDYSQYQKPDSLNSRRDSDQKQT